MKPSATKLGQSIQLHLLKQGHQVEELAGQMAITSEGLSNLIHGRRRFKDDTLQRLASTEIMTTGGFTVEKLKAYRAMDEYSSDELVLVLIEYLKSGELENIGRVVKTQLKHALFSGDFPAEMAAKRLLLLQLFGLGDLSAEPEQQLAS